MYRRIVNLHSKLSSAKPLFSSNTALATTDYFFDESTTLYTSLFFERGSGQDCHRDTPYFWTNPGYGYFGVWLALEDVKPDAGPLIVVPKSHKIIDTDLFRNEIGNMERLESGQLNPLSRFYSQGTKLKNKYSKKIMRCTTPCSSVVLPIARVSAPIKKVKYMSVIFRLLIPKLSGILK